MFEFTPDLQVYIFSLAVGVIAPVFLYWMLRGVLRHFLHAIFEQEKIEQFWMRVVFLILLSGAVSSALSYTPEDIIAEDYVAMMFSIADQVQVILFALLWSMLALFLPLLLSYTILHVGRKRPEARATGPLAEPKKELPNSEKTRAVVRRAREEARRLNHEYIGTEHLLLGLLAEMNGTAALVIAEKKVDIAALHREVEKQFPAGAPSRTVVGMLPKSPRYQRVLEHAAEYAEWMGGSAVETEHVLLGLLLENEGAAARILDQAGLKFDSVSDAIDRTAAKSSKAEDK